MPFVRMSADVNQAVTVVVPWGPLAAMMSLVKIVFAMQTPSAALPCGLPPVRPRLFSLAEIPVIARMDWGTARGIVASQMVRLVVHQERVNCASANWTPFVVRMSGMPTA